MKPTTSNLLMTCQVCILFLILFILAMSHGVTITELKQQVARQQVQIENQALDIMILKGKK